MLLQAKAVDFAAAQLYVRHRASELRTSNNNSNNDDDNGNSNDNNNNNVDNNNNFDVFWLMMSWVHAGQVLSLQSRAEQRSPEQSRPDQSRAACLVHPCKAY